MTFMPHWPIPTPGYHRLIKLGTERIKVGLAKMGNPERNLPPIIHVLVLMVRVLLFHI